MERREAVKEFLDKVTKAYIDDQKAKGIRASGKSAQSIKQEITPETGRLLGAHYFTYQRIGRRPGAMPPIEAIKQWIKDKHLQLNPWAVAKSIAKKGTDIFRGKRPGLSIEDRILEARKEFAKNLAGIVKEQIISDVKNKQRQA